MLPLRATHNCCFSSLIFIFDNTIERYSRQQPKPSLPEFACNSCILWIRKSTIGSEMSSSLGFQFTKALPPRLPSQSKSPPLLIVCRRKIPPPSKLKVINCQPYDNFIWWRKRKLHQILHYFTFSLWILKSHILLVVDNRHKEVSAQSPSRILELQFPVWQFKLGHFLPL